MSLRFSVAWISSWENAIDENARAADIDRNEGYTCLQKTTWRFEDGKQFAMITFRNDEVDGKETNLGAQ